MTWINVNDRLPDVGRLVIVRVNRVSTGHLYRTVARYMEEQDARSSWTQWNDVTDVAIEDTITHWKPFTVSWINVNDALPTHENPVIICMVDEKTGEKSSGFGRYQRERSRQFMRTFWMDRHDRDIDGPVTHWQEFPEVPE